MSKYKHWTEEDILRIQRFELERHEALSKYLYKTLATELDTTPRALSQQLYRMRTGIRTVPKK